MAEQAGGRSRTQALMHRILADAPMAHSFLPLPECILEEACIEGNCIPRQLAALLQTTLSEVEWEVEQKNPGLCEADGVSLEMLAIFARRGS